MSYPPDKPPDTVRLILIRLLVEHPGQTARWYADEAILNITSVQGALTNLRKQEIVERNLQHPEKPHNGTYNQYIWRLVVEVV